MKFHVRTRILGMCLSVRNIQRVPFSKTLVDQLPVGFYQLVGCADQSLLRHTAHRFSHHLTRHLELPIGSELVASRRGIFGAGTTRHWIRRSCFPVARIFRDHGEWLSARIVSHKSPLPKRTAECGGVLATNFGDVATIKKNDGNSVSTIMMIPTSPNQDDT